MTVTQEQIRLAAGAAYELLAGADQGRVLQLMDHLVAARQMLQLIAGGGLMVIQPLPREETKVEKTDILGENIDAE